MPLVDPKNRNLRGREVTVEERHVYNIAGPEAVR